MNLENPDRKANAFYYHNSVSMANKVHECLYFFNRYKMIVLKSWRPWHEENEKKKNLNYVPSPRF